MTPEEAENFYEEDEDPAEVFAWFDSEPDYPVPPTRPGCWFFIMCERHGWLYYLALPYWMARCRWLSRRTP
jgi:hypothetical protein